MNEIWVSVPEYEGFYEVSNKGRLKSLTSLTKRLKTVTIMKDGYCRVTLSKNGINKKALLHRVVAAAFIGKPNGLTVNHKDGNKQNNNVDNLEYMTFKDNQTHCAKVLLKRRGESNSRSKITEDDVRKIRVDTRILRKIAQDYGLAIQSVHLIKTRKNWSHVT